MTPALPREPRSRPEWEREEFHPAGSPVPLPLYESRFESWLDAPAHDAVDVDPDTLRDGDYVEFDLVRGNTVWMILYPLDPDPEHGDEWDFAGQMYTAYTRDGTLLTPAEAYSDDFSIGAPGIEPDLVVSWEGVKRVKFGSDIESAD